MVSALCGVWALIIRCHPLRSGTEDVPEGGRGPRVSKGSDSRAGELFWGLEEQKWESSISRPPVFFYGSH